MLTREDDFIPGMMIRVSIIPEENLRRTIRSTPCVTSSRLDTLPFDRVYDLVVVDRKLGFTAFCMRI